MTVLRQDPQRVHVFLANDTVLAGGQLSSRCVCVCPLVMSGLICYCSCYKVLFFSCCVTFKLVPLLCVFAAQNKPVNHPPVSHTA